ncbi:Inositol phosphoceramide mannosyltransferase 2 [Hondaea fermentalgiana]|uniref:Inositol phosphoceramide mannosyltransferase 2 n=1 Tax=Hondaea fermentalgiana TaxID=2315210 RepID=A0A2R5GVL4_9STRA|nr:Inositol phosphoceramide mannosyltransferase 2 [Hondaea fermentalgiana]|eukprot:GBG34369.1 Inositol phosphoceramide mannosyltransferase 2 [Hondaea fermentalgiana]
MDAGGSGTASGGTDNRRRSSTASRLGNLMNGMGGSGSNIVRRRGNSAQNGDQKGLVPDDFSVSAPFSSIGADGANPLRKNSTQQCLEKRSCKALLVLLGLLVLYTVFTLIFDAMHSEDPCVVARRSLHTVRNFPSRDDVPADWKPELPKIIHQQWKDTHITNPKYEMWSKRWKTLFPEPEFKHILWTDETQRELIAEHFDWFLPYYDGYKFNIQRADASRYFIMYAYGGIYADLDYEPLVNFWDHLPQDRVSLVESPYQYNEMVQNSLMSSPPKDPFWKHAFETLVKQFGKPVLAATGPVYLDITIKTNPHPWYALPCENFHRIPLGEQDQSPFLTLLHREVLGRISASYLADTGLFNLLWT